MAIRDKWQDDGETVHDYVTEKLQLIYRRSQLLMEKQLVFQVRKGLLPEIEDSMTGHRVAKIASVLELAVAEVSRKKKAEQQSISNKEQQLDRGKKSEGMVLSNEVSSQPVGTGKTESTKSSAPGQAKRVWKISSIKCQICNKQGHIASA